MTGLNQIKIILVETSHPGNIGATARAMKTMGLTQLVLVNPKTFPDPQAVAMASGAEDVLQQATVVADLATAIANCHWVLGATARARDLSWPMLTPKGITAAILPRIQQGQEIALVFGRESSGLTNDELWLCHAGITIPTSSHYRSLNLSQAVQIIAYELFQALGDCKPVHLENHPVNAQAMAQFYLHLEEVLVEIGFMQQDEPKRLLPKLKRLFNRCAPEAMEMNILRGILTQVQQWRRHER